MIILNTKDLAKEAKQPHIKAIFDALGGASSKWVGTKNDQGTYIGVTQQDGTFQEADGRDLYSALLQLNY